MESLEMRRLLTTVTNTDDYWYSMEPGSLRWAIDAATQSGGDKSVTFDSSLAGDTIALDPSYWGGVEIGGGSLTINGQDASGLTIAGALFSVAPGTTLTLENLTLTGPAGGFSSNFQGPIITNAGTLIVSDCTITGNQDGQAPAGGIYSSQGNVTVDNSTISDNYGSETGGILSENGSLTVTNSTITGNSGDGSQSDKSAGGIAVYNGNLTVSNSTISGNSYFSAREISLSYNSTATITNSTVTGISGGQLGSIYADSSSTATIAGNNTIGSLSGASGATFEIASGTTAQLSGPLTLDATLSVEPDATLQINSGGALDVESDGELMLNSSSTLTLNTGSNLDDLGTVVASGGTVDVNGGTFNVDWGGGQYAQFNLSAGGLLQINSGGLVYDTGTLALSDATIAVSGGALDLGTPLDAGAGSALQINSGGILNIGDELVLENTSTLTIAAGGSVDDVGTLVVSSATVDISGGVLIVNTEGQLNISSDSTFTITNGGTEQIDGSLAFDGGAIVTQVTGAASMVDGDLYYSFDLARQYYNDEPVMLSSWTIQWGDGSSDTYSVTDTTPTIVATHFYATGWTGTPTVLVSAITAAYGSLSPMQVILPPTTVDGENPPAPVNLTATESTAGEVDLAWQYDMNLAASFTVIATDTFNVSTTYTVPADALTYAVSGLAPDEPHTFSVVANVPLIGSGTATSSPTTVAAAATMATLSATGPSSISELGGGSLSLVSSTSTGITNNITSWSIAWTDQNGVPLGTDSAWDTSGSDPYPTPAAGTIGLMATVTATDSAGYSFALPTFSVAVVPAPATSLTAATKSPNEIDLSWTASTSTVLGYDIFEYIGGAWVPFDSVDATQTTYAVNGLSAATSYDFAVRASGYGGDSLPATVSWATATPPVATVTGPTGDLVAENGSVTLVLAADSSATGANAVTGWNVDWGNGGSPVYYSGANLTETISVPTGFHGLAIVATAETTATSSVPSYAVQADPVYVSVVPIAASAVSAAAFSATGITVNWTDTSASDSSVVLLRSDDDGVSFNTIMTFAPGSGSYDDTGLLANTTHSYEVETKGGLTGTVTATPSPTAPVTTAAQTLTLTAATTPGSASALLTWTYLGNDESGFEIQIKDQTTGENFHEILTPGQVDGTSTETYSVSLYFNDIYNFRIRADLTSGLVSDWVGASAQTEPGSYPLNPPAINDVTVGTITTTSYSGYTEFHTPASLLFSSDVNLAAASYNVEEAIQRVGDPYGLCDAYVPSFGAPTATPGDPYDYYDGVYFLSTPGASYTTEVHICVPGGYDPLSPYSGPATIDVPGTKPEPPTISASAPDADGNITVSWTPPADSYEVKLFLVLGSHGGVEGLGSTSGSSIVVPPLAAGKGLIIAVNQSLDDGISDYSNILTQYGPPSSPTNLVATLTTPSTVFMHWVDTSKDETAFHIYRSPDPSFQTNVTLIDSPGADTNQYTDTLPDEVTKYYYRVYAYYADAAASRTALVGYQLALGESTGYAGGSAGGITLTAVTFGGDRIAANGGKTPDIQSIARDSGIGSYPTYQPEWLNLNGNGTIDGGPQAFLDGTIAPTNTDGSLNVGAEHEWPISYMRSTPTSAAYMAADVTLNYAGIGGSPHWEIEGVATGYTFGPEIIHLTPGSNDVDLASFDALPKTIQSKDLDITWKISTDGGASFNTISTSHNHLFVTGGAADGAFETVVWLGCEGAKGMRPHENGELNPGAMGADQQVANAVFGMFSGLHTKRVDGTVMVYDPGQLGHTASVPLSRPDGHGQCSAWADLLYQTLVVEGVSASKRLIVAANPYNLFEVGNLPVQGGITLDQAYRRFSFHVIVEIAANPNRIYDASFGVTTDTTNAGTVELQWEEDHVTDFGFPAFVGRSADGSPIFNEVWLQRNPAGQQLKWQPWPS